MSHGRVRQFTWTHDGQKRRAWGFTVTINGRRARRQGYGSRAEAQAALDAMKHPAPASSPVATITLAEAFERYFKAKARKRSLGEDQRIAKHLKAEFGEQAPLSELTASRISLYQEKLLAVQHSRRGGALSAASINRPLALLRSLLRMACRKWEVLAAAPVIELEREGQGRLRWLTHEEAIRLLEACREQKNATLVDLVEFSNLHRPPPGRGAGSPLGRRGPLAGSRVAGGDQVGRAPRGAALRAGGRRPGPPSGRWEAEGLVFGTTSWDAFRKHWERAVKAAKLDAPLRFHDLRHTFASWAMQEGATLPELQKLLGHATLAMTMRYAHLAPKHLRSAVSRLDNVLTPARSGENRAEQVETLIAAK
jgi:integrase